MKLIGSIKGALCALFFFCINLQANYVLQNDNILHPELVLQLEGIGSELYQKTGVNLSVAVLEDLQNKSLNEKASEFSANLKSPYIFLIFTNKEHKVQIYNTENTQNLFDKERILSPMPNRGSIIPILVNHKKDANMTGVINAAVLNGYADIADEVAKSQGISLETSIGNTNRIFINILRYIFYGTLAFALFMYFYGRRKKKV